MCTAPAVCHAATPLVPSSELKLAVMPASSYSTQTRRHTRLLLARPGRAVWEYEDDVHLLKGFAEVANGAYRPLTEMLDEAYL